MSTPKAPYYHKRGSDTYHWELSCHFVANRTSDWETTYSPPAGKEQCNECKSK